MAELTPEEIRNALSAEHPSPALVERMLRVVKSRADLETYALPAYRRLNHKQQEAIAGRFPDLEDEPKKRSYQEGKALRLKALHAISDMTAVELELLVERMQYYVDHPELRDELADPKAFLPGCNEKMYRVSQVVLAYFLSPDSKELPLQLPCDTPVRLQKSTASLRSAIEQNMVATYHALGQDLDLRRRVLPAAARTGVRAAALVLVAAMALHVQGIFDFGLRKTSRNIATERIEHLYAGQMHQIDVMARAEYPDMTDDDFLKQKELMRGALTDVEKEMVGNIEKIDRVVVAPGDDVNEEIKRLFKDERTLAGLRDVAASAGNTGRSVFDKEFTWKENARRAGVDFEHAAQGMVEALFRDPKFLAALERDKKYNVIEVVAARSTVDKYQTQATEWVVSNSKSASIYLGKLALGAFFAAMKEAFRQAYSYCLGSLTGNQLRIDEAKLFFGTVAVLAGGASPILLALFVLGAPWLVAMYYLCKLIIKLFFRAGKFFFGVMILGGIRDVRVLTGNVLVSDLAVRRENLA